jgi:hypothetical protein
VSIETTKEVGMARGLVRSFLFVAALILTAAGATRADTCGTTTLNNILGTTCTIGDKTFAFSATGSSFAGIASNQIIFTADTTNPLAPGFTLSLATGGPISVSSSGNSQSLIDANINYTVSVTNGTAALLGSTFSLSNATVTLSGTTGDNGITDITNFLGSLSGASVEAFIQCMIPVGPSGCSTSTGPTTVTGTGTFSIPQSSALGQAGFEVLAASGGGSTSASFTSATYNFNESPSTTVPEPSTLLLSALGFAAFALKRFWA